MTTPAVASLSNKCPGCATVLKRATESCWKCGQKTEQSIDAGAYTEKRSFKPYLNINTEVGKQACERMIVAFSELDSRETPWCGIGAKVDLLAVSPRGVLVAVIPNLGDMKDGVIHLSQNWREPWQVETVNGQKHEIQPNPSEQAETALRDIKHSLRSFLKIDQQEEFPSIRSLVIFPDGFDFEGPKDFSIVEADEVVRLSLRTVRDLAQEILQKSIRGRLDSRSYRKWLESCILRSNDDSILGTWLDPAFDVPATQPPKRQLWQLRRPLHEQIAKEQTSPSSDTTRKRSARVTLNGRKLRLSATVITSLIIALLGWRLYGARATTSLFSGPPVPTPRSDNPPTASERSQAAIVQKISLAEDEKPDTLPVSETAKPSELRDQPAAKQEIIDSKRNHARTDASETSELKRQKVERQIRNAILLRAIEGVTVSFVEDTAYLAGDVETEAQKSAADKAARSVPGIKEFRNSIQVRDVRPADD